MAKEYKKCESSEGEEQEYEIITTHTDKRVDRVTISMLEARKKSLQEAIARIDEDIKALKALG